MRTLVLLLACASVAHSQDRDEADRLFQQGIERYNEGDFDEALAAFSRAHDIRPTDALRYNLGRVHARMDDAGAADVDHRVLAVQYFERYLADADDLSEARENEVRTYIESLSARIGRLRVHAEVEGAVVLLRGVEVATLPLQEPLRVSAGNVIVSVRATGYDAATREVTVAGGETIDVRLTLRALLQQRGTLRITSPTPGVEVRLDGEFIGTTPMTETHLASSGRHVVEGSRPGYRTARIEIDVEDSVEESVPLQMEIDSSAPDELFGALVVHGPEPREVFVDEQRLEGSQLQRIPIGPHGVRVEVPEREPAAADVTIEPGRDNELTPVYRWRADARAERVASARLRRSTGLSLVGVGGAMLAISIVFRLWAEAKFDDQEQRGDMLDFCNAEGRGTLECTAPGGWDGAVEAQIYANAVDHINLRRTLSSGGIALGLACAATGLVLSLTAKSDEQVDRDASDPSARLRLSPTGVALEGRF